MAALGIAASGIARVAYVQGTQAATIAAHERISTLSADLSKVRTENIVQSERALQAANSVKKITEYADLLNSQIVKSNAEIVFLNTRLGRLNTCDFIQQQMKSLEQRISNITEEDKFHGMGAILFSGSAPPEERQQKNRESANTEIAQLQQRLIAYSVQLGACTK